MDPKKKNPYWDEEESGPQNNFFFMDHISFIYKSNIF